MAVGERDSGQLGGGSGQDQRFELSGGALCLDFANTLESRPRQPREQLTGYQDLLVWAVESGALQAQMAKTLSAAAQDRPGAADSALDEARALREAIFQLFTAAIGGDDPPSAELSLLNQSLRRAMAHLALAAEGADYRWTWDAAVPLDRPLWPVVRSAAELLTSQRLDRVRECAAQDCAWLFLDASRNRSRRWCDMKVCGNRNKVRRFRKRP